PTCYLFPYTTLFRSRAPHADQVVRLRYLTAQQEQVGRVVDPEEEQEQRDDVGVRRDTIQGREPRDVQRVEALGHFEAQRAEDRGHEGRTPVDPATGKELEDDEEQRHAQREGRRLET